MALMLTKAQRQSEARAMRAAQPSEDQIQIAVADYCKTRRDEAQHAFHIPNESKRSKVGYMMQGRKGVRTGASDTFIPGARGGWNGMFLELKRAGERPTQAQCLFGVDMNAAGYFWAWADSVDAAIGLIDQYMSGQHIRPNWVSYSAPANGVGR